MLLPYFEDRFGFDGGESKRNLAELYGRATRFLNKLLRYGDEALGWCDRYAREKPRNADHALFGLSRHLTANQDAIRVLLGAGCVDGCQPLLRSMLDATFGINYITEAFSDERALAYQVAAAKRRIKDFRRVDPDHPNGKELAALLASDKSVPGILKLIPPGLSKVADKQEARLNADAAFVPILAEWERVKKVTGKKEPPWYSLFSGDKPIPMDTRRLAIHLQLVGYYDFLYRDWSDTTHAGDAIQSYTTSDNCIRPLRHPAGYAKTVNMAFILFTNGLERTTTFYNEQVIV